MNEARKFVLVGDHPATYVSSYFFTGSVPDGRLVLYSLTAGVLLKVIWFDVDADGAFEEAEIVPIPKWKVRADIPLYPNQIRQFMLDWQQEVGFRSHRIEVKPFRVDDPFLAGVRLLTRSQLEVLQDPYSSPEGPHSRAGHYQQILDDLAKGDFVLYWGVEEFGLTKDGDQAW